MEIKVVVGITMYALLLTLIEDSNAEFAGKVGLLVLVGAAFVYLPKVVEKTVTK